MTGRLLLRRQRKDPPGRKTMPSFAIRKESLALQQQQECISGQGMSPPWRQDLVWSSHSIPLKKPWFTHPDLTPVHTASRQFLMQKFLEVPLAHSSGCHHWGHTALQHNYRKGLESTNVKWLWRTDWIKIPTGLAHGTLPMKCLETVCRPGGLWLFTGPSANCGNKPRPAKWEQAKVILESWPRCSDGGWLPCVLAEAPRQAEEKEAL